MIWVLIAVLVGGLLGDRVAAAAIHDHLVELDLDAWERKGVQIRR